MGLGIGLRQGLRVMVLGLVLGFGFWGGVTVDVRLKLVGFKLLGLTVGGGGVIEVGEF